MVVYIKMESSVVILFGYSRSLKLYFDVVVDLLTTVFEFRSKKALENYLLTARTSFGKQLLLQD